MYPPRPVSGRLLRAVLFTAGLVGGPSAALAQSTVAVTVGGAGSDVGRAVALDASGNVVVTGHFEGTVDFDPGAGVVSRTSAGVRDVFVARYAPSGALLNVVTVGGTSFDDGLGVAIDASGNAVVAGTFQGTVDFDPGAGVVSRTSAGFSDAFVTRYTPTGALVSVVALGGASPDQAHGIALDASGHAVVVGAFVGTVDFDPGAGVQSRTSAGSSDVFVARYTAAGALVSAVAVGGLSDDDGYGVAVDASGNAVVTGAFAQTVDFDPGAGVQSRTSAGGFDVFVARYSAAGAFVSVVTAGGSTSDEGRAVALDANDNAVVTGYFTGTADFDPGPFVPMRTSVGVSDVFVARYSPAGGFVSAISFGGVNDDVGYGVGVDTGNNAVVTGYFSATTDFDAGPGTQSRTSAGDGDVFVARYQPAGAFVGAVTVGGTGLDVGDGLDIDATGEAVVAGTFEGTVDFDPGTGARSRTSAGSTDAFVVRYSTGGALLPVELVAFTARASGTTARLAWATASETNNAGFTVEHLRGTVWIASGFVAGRGTTSERTDYAFEVAGLAAGRHAFRLRQTDLDGATTLTPAVEVRIGEGAAPVLRAQGGRGVRVDVADASGARVEALDALGRVVQVWNLPSGTTDVPLAGLPAGVYVVRAVTRRGASATLSLVLSR